MIAIAGIDHLAGLFAELLLDDWRDCGVREERLENLILVRIDRSLHDVFAQSPGRIDQHDPVKAGFGVDREHDPSTAEIGAHHALHADGKRDLHVVKALGLPVDDGSVGEERGVAPPARIEQRGVAADIEKGFLLSGEARVG